MRKPQTRRDFFAVVNCWCHFPEYLKEVSSRCFKINLKVKARHRQQVLLPLHYEYALYTPKWIIQQSDDANSHNFQACSILKESLKCNNHKQEGIFCSGQMLMPFPKIYKCSRNSFMRGSRNVFVIDAETGIGFVSLWYWFIVIFWEKASAFCWKIHCGCIKCTFTMQW